MVDYAICYCVGYVIESGDGKSFVRLEICFDRELFCDLLTDDDSLEIAVIGSLTTSQYFYGSDTVRIIGRRGRPLAPPPTLTNL